jgi:colanic acid/amylovoran biosynthesis protein
MKIIVSHVYSKENKGDAALLSVLLKDLKRAFHNPDITILTLDKAEKDETFEGVPFENSFMYYARDRYKNPLVQPFYAAFVAISTLSWAYLYGKTGKDLPLPKHLRAVAESYRTADLIIPVGGGYIRSKAGFSATVTLFFILHPFFFSYLLSKPTINYTQSIGPFGNRIQEYMTKVALRNVNGTIVRESISLRLLQKWGITKNVLLSADSAFNFTSNVQRDIRREKQTPCSSV